MRENNLGFRAGIVSIAILLIFGLAWHLAVSGAGQTQVMDPEYAKLMGQTATQGKSAMPGPIDVLKTIWGHLKEPFYDRGPND
ncbi:MAG TPA: nitrate ABC transporter, permease protein, partial [Rhabdaerophilum sp.]|nr:nitrate ABC transporter, permease protein [Rhabdaerophilum sp.]